MGQFLDDSGAEPHRVNVPTACREAKRVVKALCCMQSNTIKWPSTDDSATKQFRRTREDNLYKGSAKTPMSF